MTPTMTSTTTLPISPDLLSLLRCPEDRTPLALADAATLSRINQAIDAGTLATAAGTPITQPCQAALVRADRRVAYAIVDGIPKLLVDEGIPLGPLVKTGPTE